MLLPKARPGLPQPRKLPWSHGVNLSLSECDVRLRCPWVQGDDWCPLGCECVLGRMPSDSSGSDTTIGRETQQQKAATKELLVHSVLLRSGPCRASLALFWHWGLRWFW